MTSEADRLVSAGATIPVPGGEVVVRFSLLALKRCEDRYGNVNGLFTELRWLVDQMTSGFPDPVADRLSVLLQTLTGASGPVDALATPESCIDALLTAWLEAWPPPEGKAVGETTTPPSPGTSGGASPGSTSA